MYINPVRRKKINLWLLILIVLFIVAIIFTFIHMTNSTNANSDNRYTQSSTITSNEVNKEYSGSKIGKVDSYDSFLDIENGGSSTISNETQNDKTPTSIEAPIPEVFSASTLGNTSSPLILGDHKYSFQNLGEAYLKGTGSEQYVVLRRENYIYQISTEKSCFSELLKRADLKSYIESSYNIQITSELKTGTIDGTQIIICTIADTTSVGYLIITSLNENESMFIRVLDANNMFALIQDLSNPISDISLLKENIQ